MFQIQLGKGEGGSSAPREPQRSNVKSYLNNLVD